MTRRSFLQSVAAVGALSGLAWPAPGPRVLILGGTRFLGRAFTEEVLSRGFPLALFHRGQTGRDLYPEAEHLLGDRNGQLGALTGRSFDLVLDVAGQLPAQVKATVALFPAAHYLYISSISAYASHSAVNQSEDCPLVSSEGVDLSQELPTTYAARKVACEAAAGKHSRALILRPCLIVGPHDPTDRFTYWVMRGAGKGGDWGDTMVAPGGPDDPIQCIDARDLARWAVDMAVAGKTGIYNAVGPAQRTGIGKLLEVCAPKQSLAWIPAPFLESHGVMAWKDMPAWVPPQGDSAGFTQMSNARALAQGLTFRPWSETVRDTLQWRTGQPQPLAAGLTPEREREVLAAFRST
ncbi:epimerase [bacterium]|nr:epimerase [bacterium]